MTLQLSAESERLMREAMARGGYASESDLVAEALHLLAEHLRKKAAYDEYLRREVAIGIAEIERGEYTEYTEETLHELFDAIKREGRAALEKLQVDIS